MSDLNLLNTPSPCNLSARTIAARGVSVELRESPSISYGAVRGLEDLDDP